ncbi:predicted protein [Nematostella vectensis]|uniref:Dynein assembly factor 5, axonemal n=1 Tax=Nematostella vectensis TaxID=45351 RepID=A7RYN5_NEMVE|nr:predicted protein [Nematostella vectensis]|eukprot:XP_001635412.1 predicted protein [Nematostella vectensis]
MCLCSHNKSHLAFCSTQTIGVVIQYGDGKNVDDVMSHLAQRTFDSSPTVRAMVTKVVGAWLLELRDRYSYFHKLLPYVLTGLSDEMPDIRNQSRHIMDQVGELYAKENEEELKDKLNFEAPLTYRLVTGKPNLGCRVLIQRNLSKILPAALRDMCEWTVDTRKKASALIYHLLFYAEDNTTQHMETLLHGLYKGCQDEEPDVVTMVIKSAELAGSFVEPAVFCKLILPHLKSTASVSTAGLMSCLMVLAALVRGSDPQLLQPQLQVICEGISYPDVCSAEQLSCQQQLLEVVHAILDKAGQQCSPFSYDVFKVVLYVLALSDGTLNDKVRPTSLDKLTCIQGFTGIDGLYAAHSEQLLGQLKESHKSWLSNSAERQLFDVLLTQAGHVTGEMLLGDALVVFKSCLDINRDPELRLRMFSLLSRLVMSSTDSHFAPYSVTMVTDMIIPNCVWQPGRTAGAVRAAAISCLWAILQKGLLRPDQAQAIIKDLLTQLNTCLEDHNETTRLVSCKAMQKLLTSCKDSFDGDLLHSLYPELLKRMDDSNDEIRRVVTSTFLAYFRAFPDGYDCDLYKFHLQAMFKGLLIHLDDPTPTIQEAVLAALKQAAHVKPSILKEQVEAVKHKHRVARYCDELLQHLKSLQIAGGT